MVKAREKTESRSDKQKSETLRAEMALTEALMRTRQRLELELRRSDTTLHILEDSSKQLSSASDAQALLDLDSSRSSALLDRIRARERKDLLSLIPAVLLYIFLGLLVLYVRFSIF